MIHQTAAEILYRIGMNIPFLREKANAEIIIFRRPAILQQRPIQSLHILLFAFQHLKENSG